MASGQISLNAGAILADTITGNSGPLGVGRSAIVMGSDANITPTGAQVAARILEVTSGVSLTATRNVVLPLGQDGALWLVYNGTTGSQSLQFIGSSGTGITVANGKRAWIYTDGVNIYRATADV
jgi:hypothetical protein